MGHKKPNCPVLEEKNEKDIDRAILILQTIPILINHPLVIAGIWLMLGKRYPEINALNNLLAVGEIIPTVDLNVPDGVVLGAMIDKTDDAIALFNEVKDFILDFEVPTLPSKDEIIDEAKESGKEAGVDVVKFIIDFFRPSSDLWGGPPSFGKKK